MTAKRRRQPPGLILLIWAALIFATSSTVVFRDEFFAFLNRTVFTTPEAIESFQKFWGVWWFAVVKGWHATEYAIFLCLSASLLKRWTGGLNPKAIGLGFLVTALYAASDEWHQSFVHLRFGNVMDVGIDCFGAAVASSVLLIRWRIKSRKPAPIEEATAQFSPP